MAISGVFSQPLKDLATLAAGAALGTVCVAVVVIGGISAIAWMISDPIPKCGRLEPRCRHFAAARTDCLTTSIWWTSAACQAKCRIVAGLADSYGCHRLSAGRPVATKLATARENVSARWRTSVVGLPSMGLSP
jgi:hypothetical protein